MNEIIGTVELCTTFQTHIMANSEISLKQFLKSILTKAIVRE